ncbi:MAG: M56 family metallopeptidase [Bacteroidetes bacterium]|nr:M56 family metallopeptidase [Bacteroidota bacterium]
MNFVYQLLPHEIIKAIGWTIFHSVWQGIVIAIILGALLLLTSKKSARLRYNISVAAMFIFFFISLSTFLRVYESPKVQSTDNLIVVSDNTIQRETSSDDSTSIIDKAKTNLPEIFETYFAKNLPLVVTFWFLGFIIFSLRFIGGAIYVQRLKTTGLHSLDSTWHNILNYLSGKLHLHQAVQIFESTQINVPITIGHLKPIILLPLGMISGLPQDQMEAIISHELAHIRRYDFLINMIQTFIETLFFYHPVVWWLSSLINAERENCCDDIAIQTCGNAVSYSKALYNIQLIRKNESELVLAAIGKKNQLYRRIIRMNTKNKNVAYGVRLAAFAVLLTAMAAVSIYSSPSAKNSSLNLASASFVNPFSPLGESLSFKTTGDERTATDTIGIKNGNRTITFYDGPVGKEKEYKAELSNGKLSKLYIDGEKVDEKDFPKYEGLVAQKVNEYVSLQKEYRDITKNYKSSMKDYLQKMKQFRGNHDYDFDFDAFSFPQLDSTNWKTAMKNFQKSMRENWAVHSFKIPPVHVPPINIPSIHIPPIDFDSLSGNINCPTFDNEAFKESMEEWGEKFKGEMSKFKDEMEKNKASMELFKEEMKKSEPNSEAFKKSMDELKKNMGKLKADMKVLKEFIGDVKSELVHDKLIEDRDDLDSITLSKDELVVNGTTASPELHKKYLEMYKKHYGKELKGDEKFQINN